jgi:hypothetical protein
MDESTKALSAVQNLEEKGLINPLQLYKKDDLIILQAMDPNMQAVEDRKEKKCKNQTCPIRSINYHVSKEEISIKLLAYLIGCACTRRVTSDAWVIRRKILRRLRLPHSLHHLLQRDIRGLLCHRHHP